jgi:ubiquinone/menaquinone biosynthesis C-methylase UbiE
MHSLYLSKTMLQKGSALVSTDISEEMIKQTKEKFEDPANEFLSISSNRFDIKVEELRPLGD